MGDAIAEMYDSRGFHNVISYRGHNWMGIGVYRADINGVAYYYFSIVLVRYNKFL